MICGPSIISTIDPPAVEELVLRPEMSEKAHGWQAGYAQTHWMKRAVRRLKAPFNIYIFFHTLDKTILLK